MSKFVIKETLYASQESESYFSGIERSYSGLFAGWTYLDQAKTFKSKKEAEEATKCPQFENIKWEIVEFDEEVKKLKKGFYQENARVKFHYVIPSYDLHGRGEFSTEAIVREVIEIDRKRKENSYFPRPEEE